MYAHQQFTFHQLENGLTLAVCHIPGLPFQHIDCVIFAGSKLDPIGEEGTSHFLEHVVNENAAIPSKKMRDHFADLGGGINCGMTTYDWVQYGFKTPCRASALSQGLYYLGSLVYPDSITNGMEKEREIIRGEFARSFSNPQRWMKLVRERNALYPDHVLSRVYSPLGTIETISSLRLEGLQEFHSRYYVPQNMVLVCVGGASVETLLTALQDSAFMNSKSGDRQRQEDLTEVSLPTELEYVHRRSDYVQSEEADETAEYYSDCVLPGNINNFALGVCRFILDEILFECVREQHKLTYAIGSDFSRICGMWELTIHCEALNLEGVDRIEDLVTDCIATVKEKQSEFERIKQGFVRSFQMRDWDVSTFSSRSVDDLGKFGVIRSLDWEIEGVKSLTFEDVLSVLQYLDRSRRRTMIVRP